MLYSTIIGIDAHARKSAATAVSPETGEASLLIKWTGTEQFPEPIMAVYESDPTGSPLARAPYMPRRRTSRRTTCTPTTTRRL